MRDFRCVSRDTRTTSRNGVLGPFKAGQKNRLFIAKSRPFPALTPQTPKHHAEGSIPAAIERVAGCAGGPLGVELSLTAGHIRNGTPSVRALSDLVERTESPALTRLSRTLTTAIERGSPLASVLHDQARDQRERSLAALMEEGGRREIAMLLPVVFLILPVTVMFALYPGLIALDFTP